MDPSVEDASETLPPPPPVIPPDTVPSKASEAKRLPMTRSGLGSRGQKLRLLTNHFNVEVARNEGYFYHYSVYIQFHIVCCQSSMVFEILEH